MNNEPAKMAKWAQKTDNIAEQVNEAVDQTVSLKDKINFILLVPTQGEEMSGDIPNELRSQPETAVDSMYLGGNSDNSALNSRLDNIQRQLQSLNGKLAELSEKVDL